MRAFEERKTGLLRATKFIYNNNNNNNKQGFSLHGTNNECVSVQKRVLGYKVKVQDKVSLGLLCEGKVW